MLPDYRGIADALEEDDRPDVRVVARAATAMLEWLERHADDEAASDVGKIWVRADHARIPDRSKDAPTDGAWLVPADVADLEDGLVPDRSDRRRPDHWAR